MKKILAIACLFICCSFNFSSFAQRIVSGTVYDNNKEALPGVVIVIKGDNKNATSTDINGNYSITLPEDDKIYTLKTSFIGFENQDKQISDKGSQKLDIYLTESNIDLDVIVITGTRTPKLLKNSPIITKVLTEQDIKKVDATNIGELLQSELPGIEFSYSMNQQLSLNMQGFGGNAVLFLVDGERQAGETLDNIDYSRLNLDNVERVEIIKGAASTLYGSSALGGVVNIITKMPTEPWTVNLNAKFAAHNSQRYGGSTGFSNGKFSSLTNVQHTTDGGYNMKNDGDFKSVLGSRTWNFKERIRYIFNDKLSLIGRAGYFFRERDSNDRYRDYSTGIKGNYAIDNQNEVELSYSFDQYDKSDYFPTLNKDIRDYSNVQNIVRGMFHHSFDENNSLIVGGDYMRDYLKSYQFEDNGSKHQYIADAFAQLDLNPLDKFNLITGLRYDYFSDNSVKNFTTSIATMYKVGNCSLRGSYAGGFRAPSLKEMYMTFDMASVFMIYGNPDLKPETSQNLILSTEYTNKYYNLSVSGFYNLVDNRITTAWDQELKGQVYTNIKELTIAGVDINASAKFPCGVGARLSYIYTHEDIERGQPQVSTTRPHTATARLEYGKDFGKYNFNVMLSGRYLSKVSTEQYTSITSYEETEKVSYPAYSIWKLSLLQNIGKGVDLTVAVDNIFNYVPSYNYDNSPVTTGATFSAGISINIDKFFKK